MDTNIRAGQASYGQLGTSPALPPQKPGQYAPLRAATSSNVTQPMAIGSFAQMPAVPMGMGGHSRVPYC